MHSNGNSRLTEERDEVLSILASSLKPEGTSVSSSGLDMSVRSKSGSTCRNVRAEALIRSPARSLYRGGRGGRSLGKALAARGERGPSAVGAGAANAQAVRSNRLVVCSLQK